MTRAGLVAVQRQVRRDGKTFTQTVWIKPHHESKVDRKKVIETPKWDFKSSDEIKNEVGRINGISDRSERMVLKEELLKHIEKDMGVSWTKIPATEKNAFGRNCLRAFSAAKKHVDSGAKSPTKNPTPAPAAPKTAPTPTVSAPVTSGLTVTKPAGTSYIMTRPESKDAAKALRDKHGLDKLKETMKANGVTWDETPEKGPDNMRALRALALFVRHGGEIGDGGKGSLKQSPKTSSKAELKPEPKAQKQKPEPKPKEPESKYEKDSIMYDYEKAPITHKAIALSVGILPTDEDSAKYLLEQIKEGHIGTSLDSPENMDFGLSKNEIIDASQTFDYFKARYNTADDPIAYFGNKNFYDFQEHLKGTDLIENLWEFKELWEKLDKASGRKAETLITQGMDFYSKDLSMFKLFEGLGKDWTKVDTVTGLNTLKENLKKAARDNDEEFMDDAGIFDSLDNKWGFNSAFTDVISHMSASGSNFSRDVEDAYKTAAKDLVMKRTGSNSVKDAIASGKVTKKELSNILVSEIEKIQSSFKPGGSLISDAVDSYSYRGASFLWRLGFPYPVDSYKSLTSEDVKTKLKKVDSTVSKMRGKKYEELRYNLSLYLSHDPRKRFEIGVIHKEQIKTGNVTMTDVKLATAVKKEYNGEKRAEKRRELYAQLEAAKNRGKGYNAEKLTSALKHGLDLEKETFPDENTVKEQIKSSISTVKGTERDAVEKKVQATHDTVNHRFKTIVDGVYRVKRIASEEKFQEINDKINTTGFYYHGTSLETTQKILGETGGFQVFTPKDGGKIKVGSMLGYGIYLASESSKSAQYAGSNFGRGESRGTLLLCKASLGNVVQTRVRGERDNQRIMEDPKTDTVFMDKPDVVNPEWAVKRAEQAIPRLIIDIRRV